MWICENWKIGIFAGRYGRNRFCWPKQAQGNPKEAQKVPVPPNSKVSAPERLCPVKSSAEIR